MKAAKTIKRSRQFCFDHASNKVSLDYFLDWINETVPNNATDATISLDDDFDSNGNICATYVKLEWKEEK